MKSRFFKTGFTLAEIMIVLMVIGIISAILLPIARHATPDENVLKFKKANATLGNVIRELVTSDKYYLDGDLGVKPDGSLVDSPTYFCETFANLVNAKSVNCSDKEVEDTWILWDLHGYSLEVNQEKADIGCRHIAPEIGAEITFADGTILYQTKPTLLYSKSSLKYDTVYKTFCIDIDGIGQGEAPFGYGVRKDGRILYGKRASEWMEMGIQRKD